jgi:hypothetical protein
MESITPNRILANKWRKLVRTPGYISHLHGHPRDNREWSGMLDQPRQSEKESVALGSIVFRRCGTRFWLGLRIRVVLKEVLALFWACTHQNGGNSSMVRRLFLSHTGCGVPSEGERRRCNLLRGLG